MNFCLREWSAGTDSTRKRLSVPDNRDNRIAALAISRGNSPTGLYFLFDTASLPSCYRAELPGRRLRIDENAEFQRLYFLGSIAISLANRSGKRTKWQAKMEHWRVNRWICPRLRRYELASGLGRGFGAVLFDEHCGTAHEVESGYFPAGRVKGDMQRFALPFRRSAYGPGMIFGVIYG